MSAAAGRRQAPPRESEPFVPPYAVAVLATLAACVAANEVRSVVDVDAALLLLLAVVASAWFGGLGPALLASAMGIVAFNFLFQTPRFSFAVTNPSDAVQLAVFALVALVVSRLTASRNRARSLAADALHRALHDSVTGLPNRALLEDRLERAVAEARRDGNRVAVLVLDVHGVEELHDELGRRAAEEALAGLAARLTSSLRQSDTIARLEGGEFAMLLPNIDQPANTLIAGEKVLAALREPLSVRNQVVVLKASVGIAIFPDHAADSPTLLDQADLARHRAKHEGRELELGEAASAKPPADGPS
ncbi:MAG: diguanylate cyclase [Chloroflexi bacterium]|nr:diguanylate cyclase [Chloroflexota bacterium]